MKTIMLVGEATQQNKFTGGPRKIHTLLVKYLIDKFDNQHVIDCRAEYFERNKLIQLFYLVKIFYLKKPSLIMITTFGFHIIPVFILKNLKNISVITIIHALKKVSKDDSSINNSLLDFFRNNLFRDFLEGLLLKMSNVQILPSKFFLEQSIAKGYIFSNPIIVSHGINKDFILENKTRGSDSKLFGIIGGLLKVKGTDRIKTIMDAMPENYNLKWIGYDRTDKGQSNNEILFYKDPRFNIEHFVVEDKIKLILDKILILLVPSYFESFSIITLEACARGVPVILSNTVGIKNAVESYKSGIINTFETSSSIRKSIDEIINNYDFYSRNAIKMANSLVWDEIIKNYVNIIVNTQ